VSTPPKRRLRCGLICASEKLPAAMAKCVEDLCSVGEVELALVVLAPSMAQDEELSFKRLPPLEAVDLAHVFSKVPTISCWPLKSDEAAYDFSTEDINSIEAHRLDFILNLIHADIRGGLLSACKYGTWGFRYGDPTSNAGPPGFWEMYRNQPVTQAALLRFVDHPGACIILQRCFLPTQPHSYIETLNALFSAPSYMPALVCRDILNDRAGYLQGPLVFGEYKRRRVPRNFARLIFSVKTASIWIKRQLHSIFVAEDWNVGVMRDPVHALLDPNFEPRVEWLHTQQPGFYIADPFVLKIGHLRLLAERFNWSTNRACIVEANLEDAPCVAFKEAVDEGVHMSYPYLFEFDGHFYCMPEMSQKRCVSLYEFDLAREVWTPKHTIINDFPAVDATLLQFADRWWLFCATSEEPKNAKLFIWHSSDLFGLWEPHIGNPVKVDVRSSRPGGRPFFFKGELYRPSQDCSKTYGGAITINRVTRLTTREFSEEPVAHISPIRNSPYTSGIHTLAGFGEITIIDGKRWVFAPRQAWQKLGHKVKKLLRVEGS
jgi:hypothetical protein